MTVFRTLSVAAVLTPLAAAALAQTGTPVDRATVTPIERMNTAVVAHVSENLQGYRDLFEPTMLLKLAIVAQSKVIALTCDGVELDDDRYNTVMNGILGPVLEKGSSSPDGANAINLPFVIAMSAYSQLLGGNLAVAA